MFVYVFSQIRAILEFGLVKYPPPRVDNSWYSMEGCATIVLLYIYTESVEEKKYDEEGKEMEKERKRKKKKKVDFELGAVGL